MDRWTSIQFKNKYVMSAIQPHKYVMSAIQPHKYVMSAIQPLSEKHGKTIVWNFSVTSHGKGAVDGVGTANFVYSH